MLIGSGGFIIPHNVLQGHYNMYARFLYIWQGNRPWSEDEPIEGQGQRSRKPKFRKFMKRTLYIDRIRPDGFIISSQRFTCPFIYYPMVYMHKNSPTTEIPKFIYRIYPAVRLG